MIYKLLIISLILICCGQNDKPNINNKISIQDSLKKVVFGNELLISEHLNLLKGKRVAVVANHSSIVSDSIHLIDTLLALKIEIKKIFAPEHGFRGEIEAGGTVKDGFDKKTGVPVVSLYGQKQKPSKDDLANIDVVVFDIQDVGVRYYTYIATMIYMMEACIVAGKPFILLDRPNPNGWFVDGPVLEKGFESFTGIHSVPVVYGMTLGEYATMANSENWLGEKPCKLQVIKMKGYTHKMSWEDTGREWIPPSPNLTTPLSAYLYPILCWFEGTVVSVGRGVEKPFEKVGFPYHTAAKKSYIQDSAEHTIQTIKTRGLTMKACEFTPLSNPKKAVHPLYENEACWGFCFDSISMNGNDLFLGGLDLLKNCYDEYNKYAEVRTLKLKPFFNSYFNTLVGNNLLKEQIISNKTSEEIYKNWAVKLQEFKKIRSRYLMYGE